MKYGFIIIILLLILLVFTYVFLRTLSLLPNGSSKWIFSVLFTLGLTFFIGEMALDHRLNYNVGSVMGAIGSTFFLLCVYLIFSYLITDIIRIGHAIHPFSVDNLMSFRKWMAMGSFVLIVVLLVIGSWKFNHPVVVKQEITLTKALKHDITIVVASDIHLGNRIGKSRLNGYVKLINKQKPDIILLAGDLIDRALEPVMNQKLYEELRQLKAPLGVFAIRGNHEFYSGKPEAVAAFIEKSGITLLLDSTCLIDQSFYLIGRDDRTNPMRKELSTLVEGLNRAYPRILLDHQPSQLEVAEQNHIDLQFSGHTHEGQFFPINLMVRKMFEKAHGYYRRGKTQYFISSGLGIWGPQYRIGTQSEIVVVHLRGN